jgi:hypothetical protein
MKIIAFGHQKRVGKDTAAQFVSTYLRVEQGIKRVKKAGFADKLKDVCHQLYGWAGLKDKDFYEQPENFHLKEVVLPAIGKTPRQIWISFGNEVKAATYYNTWLDYLLKHTTADWLIVSDMRFPNEADYIREIGGIVVKVTRPSVPHMPDAADDPLLNYQNWSAHIINDGSLADFYSKVIEVVNGYERYVADSIRSRAATILDDCQRTCP